jgi:hypothetical protein
MSKYNRKQNDRVYFEMGGDNLPRGYAKICGCASDELKGLGRQWIVELETILSTYPFTHITIFDAMIKPEPSILTHKK